MCWLTNEHCKCQHRCSSSQRQAVCADLPVQAYLPPRCLSADDANRVALHALHRALVKQGSARLACLLAPHLSEPELYMCSCPRLGELSAGSVSAAEDSRDCSLELMSSGSSKGSAAGTRGLLAAALTSGMGSGSASGADLKQPGVDAWMHEQRMFTPDRRHHRGPAALVDACATARRPARPTLSRLDATACRKSYPLPLHTSCCRLRHSKALAAPHPAHSCAWTIISAVLGACAPIADSRAPRNPLRPALTHSLTYTSNPQNHPPRPTCSCCR